MKTGGIFIYLKSKWRYFQVAFWKKNAGSLGFFNNMAVLCQQNLEGTDFFQGVVSGARVEIVEIWDDMRWLHTSNIYFMSSSETRISFFFKLLLVKDFLQCWIRHPPAEARTKTRAQLLHEKSQVRLEKYPKKDFKRPVILRKCDVMILEILVSFMFMPTHANLKPEVHFLCSYVSHILSARFLVRLVPRPGATL